ncbi:MAG: hypothetical protein ACLQL2_12540 [Methylovirgula sp.]
MSLTSLDYANFEVLVERRFVDRLPTHWIETSLTTDQLAAGDWCIA